MGPLYLGSNSRGGKRSRAKRRTLCEKHAVLVRFNRDAKLHVVSLAIAGTIHDVALCVWHSHWNGFS